jgi:hypothetical protein
MAMKNLWSRQHRVAQRLIGEGLDRHDAIHSIGMVLAEHIHDVLKTTKSTQDPNARYFAALERLTAEERPFSINGLFDVQNS